MLLMVVVLLLVLMWLFVLLSVLFAVMLGMFVFTRAACIMQNISPTSGVRLYMTLMHALSSLYVWTCSDDINLGNTTDPLGGKKLTNI